MSVTNTLRKVSYHGNCMPNSKNRWKVRKIKY